MRSNRTEGSQFQARRVRAAFSSRLKPVGVLYGPIVATFKSGGPARTAFAEHAGGFGSRFS